MNDPKQKEATDALIGYIAGDTLPFSTVEKKKLRTLLKNLT